jgi:hypothetical protein
MEITRREYIQRVINDLQSGNAIEETDGTGPGESGQVVVYTNVFKWRNGTYHTEQEPRYNAKTHEGPAPSGDGGYFFP